MNNANDKLFDATIKKMYSDRLRIPKDESHEVRTVSPESYEKMLRASVTASKMNIMSPFLSATPMVKASDDPNPTLVDIERTSEKGSPGQYYYGWHEKTINC